MTAGAVGGKLRGLFLMPCYLLPAMPAYRSAPVFLVALLLAGCASLSEQECRNGDWHSVGYRDGQSGRPLARLDEHRKACVQYNIAPREQAYREGRERGLNFYCTPANGLAVGRRGENYAGVCAERAEPAFLNSYEIGRDLYEARQRLERLDSEQRELEQRLRQSGSKAETESLVNRLSRLRLEHDFAWDELRRREARVDRLRY